MVKYFAVSTVTSVRMLSFNIDTALQSFCHAFILLPMIRCSKSSSSSSLFVQIKIHDANEEHMIKPEQDSKVEKNHTYCCP